MTVRKVALRGLAVVISIALLGWLVADARWQGVGARLARIDAAALIGVAALFAASYVTRGARIFGEFRDEIGGRGSVAFLRILRLTLVHNALVNVLPFRGGEAAFPVLLSRWFGVGTGRAIVSLLWLRAQDATVVCVLAASLWPGLQVGSRAALVAAVVGAVAALPLWARRHHVASSGGSATKLDRFRALLERSTRHNVAGWSWTLANWIVKLSAETILVQLALGSDASTAALGAIGAELAAILPIQGVAGFGTFEAGGAALMRTQGVAMASGLEAVLVLHAVVLSLALAAGVLAAALLPGPDPAAAPRRS